MDASAFFVLASLIFIAPHLDKSFAAKMQWACLLVATIFAIARILK